MNSSNDNNTARMHIILNGKPKEFQNTLNLKNVIEQFCLDKIPVVAELNGEIIKDPQWESTALNEGDILELVRFVGGGR